MFHWAMTFLVGAVAAGAAGFGGVVGASAGVAQILFFVFAAALVVSLAMSLSRRV